MSRFTDLIADIRAKGATVGADLEREFKALPSRLPIGLNPETAGRSGFPINDGIDGVAP